jgi:hypothetical protein
MMPDPIFPVLLLISSMVILILGVIWFSQWLMETVVNLSPSILVAVVSLSLIAGFSILGWVWKKFVIKHYSDHVKD